MTCEARSHLYASLSCVKINRYPVIKNTYQQFLNQITPSCIETTRKVIVQLNNLLKDLILVPKQLISKHIC